MSSQKKRLTKNDSKIYKSTMKKRAPIKLANHPFHLMKKMSTTIEEVVVSGSSQKRAQKRLAIRYTCICNEEDVFYRQVDHPDMVMSEYTKPVKK